MDRISTMARVITQSPYPVTIAMEATITSRLIWVEAKSAQLKAVAHGVMVQVH